MPNPITRPSALRHVNDGRIHRICHLSMTLSTGGLERLLVDFARFSDTSRYNLSFIALDHLGPPAEELRGLGHHVHSLELSAHGKQHIVTALADLLREWRIDLLHTHNTYPQYYGTRAAKRAGVAATICTQHGRGCGPNWRARGQFFLANRLTDQVLGVSEDAAALCRRQDPLHSSKIQCLWNGIDLQRFAYHGPHQKQTAISVARLSPEKDFATLLQAVRLVVKQYPKFQLRLVGDGKERHMLEQLAAELGIQESVEFLGERRDVPQLLSQAGFFVSSSTTEGISLTLLEAMAVGLPVVTTSVGGNPEIVLEGVTGRLVPPKNPDQLAKAIIGMLADQSLWPLMGEAGRQRVAQNFDIRVTVGRYEHIYERLLSGLTSNNMR